MPVPAALSLGHPLGRRQQLERPLEQPVRLELGHQRPRRPPSAGRDGRLLATGSAPAGSCRRARGATTSIGDRSQQLVALLHGQLAGLDRQRQQDLQVDLVVGAVDAARVVDRVGVDAAACQRVLDPAALGETEVASLADHPGAQLGSRRREPRRWRGRRRRRATRRPPSRTCRCRRSRAGPPGARRIAWISSVGVSDSASTPSASRACGRQRDRLRRARPHAAALGDQRPVVVVPRDWPAARTAADARPAPTPGRGRGR